MDFENNYINYITDYSDEYFISYLTNKKTVQPKKFKNIQHKVLIVPYIIENNIPKFLIVKDAKFNEWTFISGCTKKNESYSKAASRELYEETKKIIDVNINETNSIYFETIMNQNNTKCIYHIYLFNLANFDYNSSKNIISKFYSTKLKNKIFNENTDISFKTYKEICNIKNIWMFIKTSILDNFFFEKLVNDLK